MKTENICQSCVHNVVCKYASNYCKLLDSMQTFAASNNLKVDDVFNVRIECALYESIPQTRSYLSNQIDSI